MFSSSALSFAGSFNKFLLIGVSIAPGAISPSHVQRIVDARLGGYDNAASGAAQASSSNTVATETIRTAQTAVMAAKLLAANRHTRSRLLSESRADGGVSGIEDNCLCMESPLWKVLPGNNRLTSC